MQAENVSNLEKVIEELRFKNKQFEQEVAHLKETLMTKEEAHDLHLRAYQDTQERQEEQLTSLEARVSWRGWEKEVE